MINENIYGAPESWINVPYLGGGRMVTKGANFTGGTQYSNSSTLGVGNSNGKTPHGELINRTICTVALGAESIYSHMCYYLITDTYTDDEQATEFFFAVNDGQRSFTTQRSFYDTNHPNFWKVYTPSTPYNYSDNTIPITDMNPQKLLYRLEVCPCKSNGTTAPYSYTQSSDQYIYISDYDNNVRNIKTDYPYIMAARLVPYIDTSANTTHSRSRLSAPEAGFGIAVNREFTSIPNNDLKINYCQFRNTQEGVNTIPLYGYKGYFPNGYCIVLADKTDIQSAVVDYSTEKFVAHEYDSDFHEYLIRQAACFGIYVQAFGGTPDTVALDDDSIILGIIDGQGIGHGDYTRGAGNRDNDIWNWDSYNEGTFDWTKPIDPTTYSDHTTLPSAPGVMNSTTYVYVQKVTGSSNVFTLLKSIAGKVATLDDMQFKLLFLGQEPLSNIISSKRIHFRFPPNSHIGSATNIWLGAYDTEISGTPLITEFQTVEFPPKQIFEKYENFLDYEPYATISLYIPYCGSMKLPTAVFMGHSCKFTIHVNSRTGDIQAIIYVDNIEFATMSGSLAEDLAVSGLAMATYVSRKRELEHQKDLNLISGMNAMLGHAAGATISGAMNNTLGAALQAGMAVTSAFNTLEEYSYVKLQLTHAQPQSLLIQKAVPEIAQLNCLTPYLLIMRPRYEEGYEEEAYSKTIGHSCYRVGNINSFRGLTQAINPLLDDISATLTEKQMIIEALREGVILDE